MSCKFGLLSDLLRNNWLTIATAVARRSSASFRTSNLRRVSPCSLVCCFLLPRQATRTSCFPRTRKLRRTSKSSAPKCRLPRMTTRLKLQPKPSRRKQILPRHPNSHLHLLPAPLVLPDPRKLWRTNRPPSRSRASAVDPEAHSTAGVVPRPILAAVLMATSGLARSLKAVPQPSGPRTKFKTEELECLESAMFLLVT